MRSSLVAVALAAGLSTAATPAVAVADDGVAADFVGDAKLFYRIVACGGSDPLPAGIDAPTVEKHCAEMAKRFQHYTKKYVLSALYFTRATVTAVFVMLPVSPLSVYLFGAVIGFLWLGTVPVTSGLIAQVFGVKYLSTLTGIAFLFHQVGSFLGVWIGGYLFDVTGSYQLMWILTIGLGVLAALINLPIDDRQIVRPAAAAA